jgi:hypothetical protein
MQKLCLATGVLAAFASGSALAGPALDDDKKPAPTAPMSDPVAEPPLIARPAGPEYGVGIRLRNVRAPRALIELFGVERATGASNFGFGVDLVRRRGTVEIQLGFEYEHVQPDEGVFINSGENVAAGNEADYIVSPSHNPNNASLGWFTIEFTFLNHAEINKYLSFRYGGGVGLGIVTGELWHYNVICVGATNSNPEPGCKPASLGNGGTGLPSDPAFEKYDLPPVFPVVNAILGLQVKPMPKMTINVEGGIRTFPFFGVSGGYFF